MVKRSCPLHRTTVPKVALLILLVGVGLWKIFHRQHPGTDTLPHKSGRQYRRRTPRCEMGECISYYQFYAIEAIGRG